MIDMNKNEINEKLIRWLLSKALWYSDTVLEEAIQYGRDNYANIINKDRSTMRQIELQMSNFIMEEKFQDIATAPKDKPILLLYEQSADKFRAGISKEDRRACVEARWWGARRHCLETNTHVKVDNWQEEGEWCDYANRVIQKIHPKAKSKNKVLGWMPLPSFDIE